MKRISRAGRLARLAVLTSTTLATAALAVPATAAEDRIVKPLPVAGAGAVVGTLVTADRQPVAGAEVQAWWQGPESRPGEEVPPVVMGAAKTTKDGGYGLDFRPTAAMLREAKTNGGWLNFFVSASFGSEGETVSVSRQVNLESGTLLAPEALEKGAVVEGDPLQPSLTRASLLKRIGALGSGSLADEAASEGVTTTISEAPELNLTLDVSGSEVNSTTTSAAAAATTFCTAKYDDPLLEFASVMEFHKATNSSAWWAYGEKADTSMETAIKTPPQSSYKISGSAKISNSLDSKADMEFTGNKAKNAYARTKFQIKRWRYVPVAGYSAPEGTQCYGMGSDMKGGTRFRSPGPFAGGVQMNSSLPGAEFIGCSNANLRVPYPKNSGFTRKSNKASKITGAVDAGVISLGAQSGFSATVTLRYKSTVAPGIWACGTSALPTVSGVVHAQNR